MTGFNNPIVGGGGALVYPSIHSPNFVTGVSGWTINKDGSAEFDNLTIRGTFNGTDFILNSSGLFFYSSAPALGNLIASSTNAAGNDQFGNAYLQGDTAYQVAPSPNQAVQTNLGTIAWYNATGPGGPWTQINTISLANSPSTNLIIGADLVVGTNLTVNGQLSLLAGGGPFINGESFHTISNAAGFSGTMRVKKLPWNAIWLDVELTVTTAGGASFSFGSLPDSTYYPTTGRHFPLSLTGANLVGTAFAGTPRLHMPTSGAVAIELPTLSANAALTLGLSVMYPTN